MTKTDEHKAGTKVKKQQWHADWELSIDQVRHYIYSQFPQLSSLTIKKLGEGWDNDVFLVGDDYIFRFPRREIAVSGLITEGVILPMIDDYVTLPYSKPVFFGKGEGDFKAPFLGYNYLAGKFPIGLTDEQRASSTLLLAGFLKKLHTFPVEQAIQNGVPFDSRNLLDITTRKQRMFGFLETLAPYLLEEEYLFIKTYLLELNTERITRKDVFMHGDLHFKNILVNANGEIAGIIDWGDMNIGHPACDLSIAFSFLPASERERFFKVYGEVDEETLRLARLIAVFIPMLIMMQALEDREDAIAAEAKGNILRAICK